MVVALSVAMRSTRMSPEEDANTVAALDTKYQAAVKSNDAGTMDASLPLFQVESR
jgi:hypothetical protein